MNCNEFTRLLSRSLDADMPPSLRLRMRIHLWMCKPCATYSKHLGDLRNIVTGLDDFDEGPELPADAAARLQMIIEQELHAPA
jgi:hypothetical protein